MNSLCFIQTLNAAIKSISRRQIGGRQSRITIALIAERELHKKLQTRGNAHARWVQALTCFEELFQTDQKRSSDLSTSRLGILKAMFS